MGILLILVGGKVVVLPGSIVVHISLWMVLLGTSVLACQGLLNLVNRMFCISPSSQSISPH